jgi:hypothetical protein
VAGTFFGLVACVTAGGCGVVLGVLDVDLVLVMGPDITTKFLDNARPGCATSAAVATAAIMVDRAMVIRTSQ